MKFIRVFLLLMILWKVSYAKTADPVDTAAFYYGQKEYYSAITELMRYQYLYPGGTRFAESMVLMAQSYYMGGNSPEAIKIFSDCYIKYPETPAGQQALYFSGFIRLNEGSFYYAAKNFQEYNFVYRNGEFYDDSVFNICLAKVLAENYNDALTALSDYRKQFPGGKHGEEALILTARITERLNRPEKSLWIAGISSAVIPGLGYFYTERYLIGLFAMLSNGALIYLAYDGYRDKNMFQLAMFSVIEFSFYNWSLGGSILSARDYNNNEEFSKEIMLHIKTPF